MGRFRKIPIEIDAYQYKIGIDSNDVIPLKEEEYKKVGEMTFVGLIKTTLEDTEESYHYVCDGDWIITGAAGEKYTCKDEIFRKTYEEVEDGKN
jgi:hypothetical protein